MIQEYLLLSPYADMRGQMDCECEYQGEARENPCAFPAIFSPSEGITEPGDASGDMELKNPGSLCLHIKVSYPGELADLQWMMPV